MGIFKKWRKKEEKPAENVMSLDDVYLSGTEPPETRYTQDYQDFLASQEAAETERSAAPAETEEYPAVSPEGFCAQFERCSTSLIEEPEYCEVCVFFCDGDRTCRRPERMQ